MKHWILVVCAAVMVSFPGLANAIPLGSVKISQVCPHHGSDSSVWFYVGLTDNDIVNKIDNPEGVQGGYIAPIFEPLIKMELTADYVDHTFEINGSNYEYWENMVSYVLTDGDQDWLGYNLGSIDPHPQPFEWSFSNLYTGNRIDFEGYMIQNLLLTIVDIHAEYATSLPGGIPLYDWTATWTLTVDGLYAQVPEPPMLLLIAAGLICLAANMRNQLSRPALIRS